MAAKIVWSPEAIEDIELIAQYIARDSVFYANSVVSEIFALSRSISDHPLSGRIVPELGNEQIRERFVYSYRVIYNLQEQRILVVAIIHGSRLLDKISERI